MIEVLGPLQVRSGDDDDVVDVGSPRHREVLAALVVDAGRVVSTDTLLERVWGDVGRGASTSNLHAVISRLRGRLAAAHLDAAIATASPGYRLDAPRAADAVDALRFQDLLAHGRAAHAAADASAARSSLEEALGLWRGPAYADIRLPFAEVEAARLEGQRLAACELLVDVELELGHLDAALDRLPTLVAAHPLRESFRRQLMLALYRSGRQAEALEAYADLRAVLSEELGIDPGPDLQELHQRVLEQDEDLRASSPRRADAPAVAAADPAATPRPAAPDTPAAPGEPVWHSEVVVPADDLVGRGRDVSRLVDLLTGSAQRLVTVTGVGGVGKTRLAHAVAVAARDAFADGVVLVSLAPVTDPALVLPAIGRAAGLAGSEGPDPLEAVAAHLRPRELLVVADNLEHLLDSAPDLARLVALCPRLSVLVTSRTTLRVRGELHYQLAPLALPAEEETDPGVLAGSAAVALFVDRARGVRPDLELDDETAVAVAGICRRLAGIPLAIELAAARADLMPPVLLLQHLDRVMAGTGARDLPARQRTMRAAIEWSHRLLSPEQQTVLRRLAVFAGGFTLEAVEAVLPDTVDAFGVLDELVAHSLVQRDPDHPDVLRFRMLEPVAQFADALLEGDERRAARDAHLAHFLRLAEDTEPGFRGPRAHQAVATTHREHANLVAAVEWALASGQGDLAGRMTWAMWLFWWLRGNLLEGRRLAQGVLDQHTSDETRVRAHAVLAAMTFAQGDTRLARHWCAGVTLARRIGDVVGEAHNLAGEGLIALAEGHLDEAEVRFVETIRLTEDAGLGGEWLWTLAHVWQATVRLVLGFPDQAEPLLAAALAAARSRRDPLATYITLFTSVQVATAAGDLGAARSQLEEGIALSIDTGDMANLAYFLEALAVVESQHGRHETVAVLHGAAGRLRDTVGSAVYGYYKPDEQLLDVSLAAAAAHLGAAYDDAVARGRSLDIDEVVALSRS